jgi:hypothetical protein
VVQGNEFRAKLALQNRMNPNKSANQQESHPNNRSLNITSLAHRARIP